MWPVGSRAPDPSGRLPIWHSRPSSTAVTAPAADVVLPSSARLTCRRGRASAERTMLDPCHSSLHQGERDHRPRVMKWRTAAQVSPGAAEDGDEPDYANRREHVSMLAAISVVWCIGIPLAVLVVSGFGGRRRQRIIAVLEARRGGRVPVPVLATFVGCAGRRRGYRIQSAYGTNERRSARSTVRPLSPRGPRPPSPRRID
jgi:hypothetical protein